MTVSPSLITTSRCDGTLKEVCLLFQENDDNDKSGSMDMPACFYAFPHPHVRASLTIDGERRLSTTSQEECADIPLCTLNLTQQLKDEKNEDSGSFMVC